MLFITAENPSQNYHSRKKYDPKIETKIRLSSGHLIDCISKAKAMKRMQKCDTLPNEGKRERKRGRDWSAATKKLTFWTQGCGLFFSCNHINNSALSSHKACQWRVFHFHIRLRLNICGVQLVGQNLLLLSLPHFILSLFLFTCTYVRMCSAITFAIAKKPNQLVDASTVESVLFVVTKVTDFFWRVHHFDVTESTGVPEFQQLSQHTHIFTKSLAKLS